MTTHEKLLLCLLAPTVAAFAGDGRVQSPDAKWKTIRTAHYKIHYPANPKGDFDAFVKEVASKIEGIHATVAKHVGFEAKGPINVIIRDPLMTANGGAVPILTKPMMVLWKTPPERDSQLGHYDNWVDLLLTHEITHLHHLLRPKNGAKPGWFPEVLPKRGPIMLKAPMMIIEGYAVLSEGRITGFGRPHSAYRAAIIREWALSGILPTYDGASSGSMAYLVGSAYLEWLEKQYPEEPDILQKFWKQLVSKKDRNYADTFVATFGERPANSYGRWKAAVTHDAVAFEQSAKAKGLIREGELVFRLKGRISDLAISPDGTKLLARVYPWDSEKQGIRVWDLVAEPEPDKNEKKWAKLKLKDDPNEIEDRKPESIEPKKMALIGARNGRLPSRAWWAGENQVGYELRVPNKEGVLVPTYWVYDLKTKSEKRAAKPEKPQNNGYAREDVDGAWNIVQTLPDGSKKQLTRTLTAAWQPSPAPDGKSLYFVRDSVRGDEVRKLDLTQPEIEAQPEPMPMPDTIIVPGTIFSAPNAPSLLPPPSTATIQPTSYSVWDSQSAGYNYTYSISPATDSIQLGFAGSDMLNRLNWRVGGAVGGANGPRGVGAGLMYRGWRLAPSLQAFTSLEKPSRQRFMPIEGYDRERQGGEFALTWQQHGLTPITIKPFAAFEAIKDGDPNSPVPFVHDQTRTMWGAMANISSTRTKSGEKGEWGIGFNASFQGAQGTTSLSEPLVGGDSPGDWQIARLGLGVRFITPIASLNISAQEGRLWGDPGLFDMFHLGGMNTFLVQESLDMNRLQQPALPGYTQVGDRMRSLRAEWGADVVYLYYEKSAAWHADFSKPEYQTVAGAEIRFNEELADLSSMLPDLRNFEFTVGIHRVIDGAMKNRTVGTISVGIRF